MAILPRFVSVKQFFTQIRHQFKGRGLGEHPLFPDCVFTVSYFQGGWVVILFFVGTFLFSWRRTGLGTGRDEHGTGPEESTLFLGLGVNKQTIVFSSLSKLW